MRDIFWKDGLPGIVDGIFSVLWTFDVAIQINTCGVNEPIRIAVIQGMKDNMSARMLTDPEPQEYHQALSYMKISMQKLADSHKQEDSTYPVPTFQNQ
ncbi:MAG: hypothetical protein CVU51_00355 [Deltaproteobacteria bacterium HGW-Deltaproteobacteria-1]|jgi:hypothetical protein|nr:MAG: hypothetical protein CVU51_00355 [Deltaproteobacteria bacterium HGW-Deltaproteobacteria-1]